MMAGCAEQQDFQTVETNTSTETTHMTKKEGCDLLLAKARWGDGMAYLKLAECCIYGEGVKPDFLGAMTMLSLSRDYGGTPGIRTYVNNLPDDNNVRMACEAKNMIDLHDEEKAMEISDDLIGKGFTDGYIMESFAYLQMGDTAEMMRVASTAAEQGNTPGKAILFIKPVLFSRSMPDEELIDSLAEEVPALYRLMGENLPTGRIGNPDTWKRLSITF